MKKKLVTAILSLALIFFSAFKVSNDIITRLGLAQAEAQKNIFGNIVADFPDADYQGKAIYTGIGFKIPTVKLLPEIIKGDKVGAAKELCAYVKMYCNSGEFIDSYNKYRDMYKPKPTDEPV